MFGSSNAFGQSSNFGNQTQSVFGQTNNASSNPFGSSTTPCDAQTGSSMFGSNSTGVFGAPQLASFPQTFGISTPAFRTSSLAPTSSPFGGNSTFGQKSFGLSIPQSTTFGSSSTPFGASSTPAFGPISTSGFGGTSTHGFGGSSTSSFGTWSSPAFGTTPTPTFGSSGTASSYNAFGSRVASGTPTLWASSTPSFSFGTSQAFVSSFFGSTQSSPFGALGGQGLTTTFWGQEVGSRVIPYAPTTDAEKGIAGKIVSISAMDAYKNKTHEELRWEDFYHRGDKGGQLPTSQSPGGVTISQPSFIFPSPQRALDQTYATPPNPFSSLTTPSAQTTPTTTTKFSSPFGQPTITPSIFVQTNNVSIPSSTGSWNQLSGSPSLATNNSPLGQTTTPVGLTPDQSTKTSVDFGCNNFVQPQIATNPTGVTCETGSLSQSTFEQVPAPANSDVMEPIIVTNPFGTTLHALPQGGNSPLIQYGISSIPVVDKPAPVGISPLLSFRNLSQRRGKARLPTRKYRTADDGPKVPFFQ